jgi:L,D-peptidoglycan transpeptidase YkuD (ErfK/YbiS/YcfS/YnhG family)
MRRIALCAAVVVAAGIAVIPAAAQAAVHSYRCFHVRAPYHSYATQSGCRPGFVRVTLRIGTAQVLTVTNWQRSSSYARFNGFSLVRGKWAHRWGPWAARIGASGFARPGQKIEGDELTPQGSYGFQFMFGVKANPGVHFKWRHAYRYDYWDDDPNSARYNLWTDTRYHHAGVNPEPMHNVPVYNYAAVIGYNLARVPGAGSAIFLHVGDGQATAGCVSVSQSRILKIIRWLRPRLVPVIAMRVL